MARKKKGGNSNEDEKEPQAKEEFKFDFSSANKETQAALLPVLQKKLDTLVGQSSGYLETLPSSVQRRVKALKHLQSKVDALESEFIKEKAALELKYSGLKTPFYDRRTELVIGKSEPVPEELVEPEGAEKTEVPVKVEGAKEEDVKGIPQFWLTALKHHEDFADMIVPTDEPALEHLFNVTCSSLENEETPTPSFKLSFHFTPNDFFEETVLSKTYHLIQEGMNEMFDHVDCTEITWKEGKNLTVKKVTKKDNKKGKRGGKGGKGGKPVVVEEQVPSFFRFFEPIPSPEEEEMDEEEEEELQAMLESDYDYGVMLKTEIIPNAVGWFTGEASTPMVDFEGEDDEGGDDGEDGQPGLEDYNSEDDEDFDPKAVKQPPQPQQECKQQ